MLRWLFLWFCVCCSVERAESSAIFKHDRHFDDLLPASLAAQVPVHAHVLGACAHLCGTQNACEGVFYREKNGTCHVSGSVHTVYSGQTTGPASGFRYFRRTPLKCPGGNVHEPTGTCYVLYVTPKLNWTQAESQCQGQGGQLAVPDTAEKMTFIDATSWTLIGGRRPLSEWGITNLNPPPTSQWVFEWVNGETMNRQELDQFWMLGDPNGFNSEYVLALHQTGLMVDFPDNYITNYICEYPLL